MSLEGKCTCMWSHVVCTYYIYYIFIIFNSVVEYIDLLGFFGGVISVCHPSGGL